MPGSPRVMENTILPELDNAYTALTLSARYARDSEEWAFINARISEVISLAEKVAGFFRAVDGPFPVSLKKLFKELLIYIKKKDIYDSTIKLTSIEEKITKINILIRNWKIMLYGWRTISSLVVIVSSILFLVNYYSNISFILALSSLILSFSSIITIKIKYSTWLIIISSLILLISSLITKINMNLIFLFILLFVIQIIFLLENKIIIKYIK